jgi:hypothetical protein
VFFVAYSKSVFSFPVFALKFLADDCPSKVATNGFELGEGGDFHHKY